MELFPENVDAVHTWSILSDYSRGSIGMDNAPAKLKLQDIRAETDRIPDSEGVFQKVLYVESVMYGKIIDDYVRRQKR